MMQRNIVRNTGSSIDQGVTHRIGMLDGTVLDHAKYYQNPEGESANPQREIS